MTNLPFGRRVLVDEPMPIWQAKTLAELARVTRSGGRVVVLVPIRPVGGVPRELHQLARVPIRLLGTPTVIWAYHWR